MAQVGVLGNLKYKSATHSPVLDLGSELSNLEISLRHTVPDGSHAQINPIPDLRRALRWNEIEYSVPDIIEGEDFDVAAVQSDILDLVERKDPALGVFLLIGEAGRFVEMADVASYRDTVTKLRRLARSCINQIPRRSEDINVNAAALYNLLAAPPHGDLELRTKLRRASQPLVILFLAPDPSDVDRRRLSDEKRTLDDIVKSSIVDNAFTIRDAPGCRIRDITQALLRHKPTLLHFSGHGSSEGFCFQDGSGKAAVVKPQAFAKLLALAHRNGLKAAVMNAFCSDEQAQLLANAAGHAIVMEGPLSDQNADSFTREFYGALGSGETFEDAFEWAIAGAGIDSTNAVQPKLFKSKATEGQLTDQDAANPKRKSLRRPRR